MNLPQKCRAYRATFSPRAITTRFAPPPPLKSAALSPFRRTFYHFQPRRVNPCRVAPLSRFFRDNLSRFFTGPLKTLVKKYFRPTPKPLRTFFWRHPNCQKTQFPTFFGRCRLSQATAPPRNPTRDHGRTHHYPRSQSPANVICLSSTTLFLGPKNANSAPGCKSCVEFRQISFTFMRRNMSWINFFSPPKNRRSQGASRPSVLSFISSSLIVQARSAS